jgi:hypothetical protein
VFLEEDPVPFIRFKPAGAVTFEIRFPPGLQGPPR